MFSLEWLFLMQIFMGILMIMFLQKLTQMKEQVDEITKEVTNYISYVTEEMTECDIETIEPKKKGSINQEMQEKIDQEEVQNRIIQAVLGEYFQ